MFSATSIPIFPGELPLFHNFPISAAPQKPRRAPLAGEWLARVARMAWWRADASAVWRAVGPRDGP